MATALELGRSGDLIKVDAALSSRQQEFRQMFASPRLIKWLRDVLPGLESAWQIEVSPSEQLDIFLTIYASGETLSYGRSFKPISHVADGIWALKTADIRVFGWFSAPDLFIGHVGDWTQRIKEIGLYHGYAGEVERYRNLLNLDEPKFVPGEDPNAVVSNFNYP